MQQQISKGLNCIQYALHMKDMVPVSKAMNAKLFMIHLPPIISPTMQLNQLNEKNGANCIFPLS